MAFHLWREKVFYLQYMISERIITNNLKLNRKIIKINQLMFSNQKLKKFKTAALAYFLKFYLMEV